MPTIPEAVWFACRRVTLSLMMLRTEAGATLPMLVMSDWVTE